jgi:hypothetical protein
MQSPRLELSKGATVLATSTDYDANMNEVFRIVNINEKKFMLTSVW